ncbi:hypothetical protein CEXT_428151 [Caerostris extrusa]|uniref:Uncharacterized protein n=1 Tax=Caerostris extrusa TaxID=172846 RepID=A0AAV4MR10_CAEEX|nr:hypothetical protein CEXT_428151 [Caerostris extrusa]
MFTGTGRCLDIGLFFLPSTKGMKRCHGNRWGKASVKSSVGNNKLYAIFISGKHATTEVFYILIPAGVNGKKDAPPSFPLQTAWPSMTPVCERPLVSLLSEPEMGRKSLVSEETSRRDSLSLSTPVL